jgi:hypothetical protein
MLSNRTRDVIIGIDRRLLVGALPLTNEIGFITAVTVMMEVEVQRLTRGSSDSTEIQKHTLAHAHSTEAARRITPKGRK